MCAINPTHKKRFIIDVYTSLPLTKEEFEIATISQLLIVEQKFNEAGNLRFHLKESTEEAD